MNRALTPHNLLQAIAIAALCLLPHSLAFAISQKTKAVSITLQLLHSHDRKECYELVATCDLATIQSGDDTSYVFTNVELTINKYGPKYNSREWLGTFSGPNGKTAFLTTLAPLWNGGYVPGGYQLPSGRLYFGESGQLRFVVYAKGKLRLLSYSPTKSEFFDLDHTLPKSKVELRKVFIDSFANNDVYWCYAMVSSPTFFGIEVENPLRQDQFWDLDLLYDQWNRMLKGGKPKR